MNPVKTYQESIMIYPSCFYQKISDEYQKMGCFVRGDRNGMGCFVWGDKNLMGCFCKGGKSLRDVLSRVSKMTWDVLSGSLGFPIGDFFGIISFLLAGVQACQFFENDLMATCKRLKDANSGFIARF